MKNSNTPKPDVPGSILWLYTKPTDNPTKVDTAKLSEEEYRRALRIGVTAMVGLGELKVSEIESK